NVSHFEFYDVQHISNKFIGAPQYLQERLGKANVRRRQLLLYYRMHCDKIAGRYSEHAQPKDVPQNVPRMNAEDTNQSRTSYSSSIGSAGMYALRVPPLPESASDNSPFQCPICYTIIAVNNQKSWKRHVFQDLRPYVCTFEGCAKSDHLFDSQHEWFEHETELHRRSWHCNRCDEEFSTSKAFEKHLQERHSNSYTERYLQTICPLCGEIQSFFRLQKHLASHMQQVALFVLKPSEVEEKDE
ncbi:hypothetical protein BDD12DRAFT_648799, partial [Trichophaea hybrida]